MRFARAFPALCCPVALGGAYNNKQRAAGQPRRDQHERQDKLGSQSQSCMPAQHDLGKYAGQVPSGLIGRLVPPNVAFPFWEGEWTLSTSEAGTSGPSAEEAQAKNTGRRNTHAKFPLTFFQ